MENITETVKAVPSDSLGFFKYVFNFDDENKCEILNMGQYAVLAIIPVLIVLKAVKHLVPEEDESKGSLEIMAESLGQLLFIICAIWFINRMIRYVPTYSGCEYGKFNATNFLLPFIIILATMQTKLGAKLNILLDRVVDRWEGNSEAPQQASSDKSVVRTSQPLAPINSDAPDEPGTAATTAGVASGEPRLQPDVPEPGYASTRCSDTQHVAGAYGSKRERWRNVWRKPMVSLDNNILYSKIQI